MLCSLFQRTFLVSPEPNISVGYKNMLVLHPKELPLVHKYFSPTDEEVGEAKEMIRLTDLAIKDGKGVDVINGKFIGPPMVTAAEKVLSKQKLIKGE